MKPGLRDSYALFNSYLILIVQNRRIVFRSSRSLIWIKDLLLHVNPCILHLGIISHLFSFHENVHTKGCVSGLVEEPDKVSIGGV